MTPMTLRADCARCAALCCVAFAFDRSELFAIDKPVGVRCPHLKGGAQCAIHAEREARGFGGCVGYDCRGAGQRVVQDLFGGASWEDEPDLLGPMLQAFAVASRAHELLMLLDGASKLDLSRAERRRLRGLKKALNEMADNARIGVWSNAVAADVHEFLQSLRRHAPSVRALERALPRAGLCK